MKRSITIAFLLAGGLMACLFALRYFAVGQLGSANGVVKNFKQLCAVSSPDVIAKKFGFGFGPTEGRTVCVISSPVSGGHELYIWNSGAFADTKLDGFFSGMLGKVSVNAVATGRESVIVGSERREVAGLESVLRVIMPKHCDSSCDEYCVAPKACSRPPACTQECRMSREVELRSDGNVFAVEDFTPDASIISSFRFVGTAL